MELHTFLRPASAVHGKQMSFGSDAVLAIVVIAIVALMILPLPTFLLDGLVAVNIALGIMLVLMGIYIQTALQFSAFPSVLLISTLFRLALSVATTRMILLEGDAGSIIDTFGGMVAGGNVVVGLVVFLIITLVQFLVIAKGAERVAEVGARFTLDAMPGKQMSIDSDLRSGLIDKHEARRKRRELELESKLHGSMDGAMKFVKGDAIAGIVIIIVNLLGGLAVGVFQFGMPAGEAMQKYSILTIGDGLVAQIPALLGAMSAGLIVTRVTDVEADRHLGDSIRKQFLAIPKVLLIAGAMCLAAALVPGFPKTTFVFLGLLLGFTGALLVPAFRARFDKAAQPAFETIMRQKREPRSVIAGTAVQSADRSVPLLLSLPAACSEHGLDELLRERVETMLHERRVTSGVDLPTIRFYWRRDGEPGWTLHAYEVPIASGEIEAGEGEVGQERIVAACAKALRRQATLFVGLQETSDLLVQAATELPDIVKEVQRAVPLQNIAAILRRLVEEEVSIRNVRGILEALVQAGQFEKDVNNLAEYARMALGRQICYRVAPDAELIAVGLDQGVEESLTQSLRKVREAQQLVIDPGRKQALIGAIGDAVDRTAAGAVIVPVPLRRHVRSLLVAARPDLPVLSYAEIVSSLELTVAVRLGEADLVGAAPARLAPVTPPPTSPDPMPPTPIGNGRRRKVAA